MKDVYDYLELRFNCPQLLELKWCNKENCKGCENHYPLERIMVLIINKLQEKINYGSFQAFCWNKYCEEKPKIPFCVWLFGDVDKFIIYVLEAMNVGVIRK